MKRKYLSKTFACVVSFSLVLGLLAGCGEVKDDSEQEAVSGSAVTEEAVEAEVEEETSAEYTSDIFVEKLANYDEDSIRGVDVSSVLSIMDAFDERNKDITDDAEKAGYRDREGNLLDRQGFFNLLADAGVNYIRTRVWNDPYDSAGNSYGGGANSVERAKEIATYATKAGMSNLIDFHMSDFWADPGKQMSPKAWEKFSADDKAAAIADFVIESLAEIEADGAIVNMAQIGNETNGSFCGETQWTTINKLLDAGCDAIHDYAVSTGRDEKSILAAVHFTELQNEGEQISYAAQMSAYDGNEGVSYDVFASSYYPYWHGTLDNLKSVLGTIAKNYDKYVMIAETSWAYTLEEGDGQGNTVSVGSNDVDMPYRFTEQGQADEVRAVANAVNEIDATLSSGDKAALGFFYWEPAWIPVNYLGNYSEAEYETELKINKELWEKTGSGWASSYAAEYDPEDAGRYFGGSAVDNQAIFDFMGNPLSTLDVFKYLIGGSTAEKKLDGYSVDSVSVAAGEELTLPDTVTFIYNDGTEESGAVVWDEASVAEVDTGEIGTYRVQGAAADDPDFSVECVVNVLANNILFDYDYSFEDEDSKWTIDDAGIFREVEDTKNNAVTGSAYINVWGDAEVNGSVASPEISINKAGSYTVSVVTHGNAGVGGDDGESVVLTARTGDGKTYKSKKIVQDGWQNYITTEIKNVKITKKMISSGKNTIKISLKIKLGAGEWMAADDFGLVIDD